MTDWNDETNRYQPGGDRYQPPANKILSGLVDAAEYARVRRHILDWIREDVPLAGKMNLYPEHVSKLMDRICGSKTRAR